MDTCERIVSQLGALFLCEPVNGFTRVRTPFLYPDGDVIDVFVKESGGSQLTVSDLGEGLRWLQSQSIAQRRSPRQLKLIDDVRQTCGLELFRGMLMARASEAELADAVLRVAQGSLRVADLWFTLRSRAVESMVDEVDEFLAERRVPFERRVTLPGRSGRVWTVDFQVRQPTRSTLMSVLTSGSRAGAAQAARNAVALWHDLSHLRLGREPLGFLSVFDDTAEVWSEEDFRLVESISEIARWSRPDELEAQLAA